MEKTERIGFRIPILTLCLCGLSLFIFIGDPKFSEALVYNRQAILNGEMWRIITAPLVHFSGSHLFWNLAVLGIVGCVLEISGCTGLWMVYGFSSLLSGVFCIITLPEVSFYGGLSGLATGAVAYLCFWNLGNTNDKFIWLGILILVAIKIGFEFCTNNTFFTSIDHGFFKVLPWVHLFGFSGAVAAGSSFIPEIRKKG